MAFSAYKILVYAVVLVAVVYFLASYLPTLFPQEDPLEAIQSDLDDAQYAPGKSFSSSVTFSPGSSLSAELLDSRQRSVNFECNEPSICCEKNDNCGRVEWDERNIYFPAGQRLIASGRCLSLPGLKACTVYFGVKPAQFELTEFPEDGDFDFAEQDRLVVSVKIKNVGEKIAAGEAENSLKVYQTFETAEGEQKVFQFELSQAFKNLYPGDEETVSFDIPLGQISFNGDYLFEFKGESSQAGFVEDSFYLNVKNAPSPCRTTQADQPALVAGQCQRRLNCQDCTLASACANAWRKELGKELPLVDPSYTVEELPAGQCP